MLKEVDESLRQLRIHHFDLLMLHWPIAFVHREGGEMLPKGPDGKIELDKTANLRETWGMMEKM